MDRTEAKITDAELEVMGALWSGAGPMTLSQLKDALARSQGWSGDTTKTLLRRLCGKGAVEQEKREVYYYRPLVSEGEYVAFENAPFLEGKGLPGLVTALYDSQSISREDLAELRAFLDEAMGKGGGT